MIPVRLEMQNFLAYRAPNPIDFEGIHLACLIGANGAGKSSLLDAITWALWGKARTRRDNDLIYLGKNDMMVQLDFLHEGQTYRVVRRRNRRGASGTGRLDLFIFSEDEQLVEIREGSSGATQNRINDLLRLDYETFVNSAFLQQGQADSFTTQQPAKRKQILANILGLEAWDVYEEIAKKHANAQSQLIANLEGGIRELQEKIDTEPALRQDLLDAEAAHAEASATLQTIELLLAEVQDSPVLLENAQNEQKQEQSRRDAHQRDIDQTITNMEDQAEQITGYEHTLENRAEIERGYETLTAAREASEELSKKLSQLRGIDEKISRLENQLTAERTRLEAERDEIGREIARLHRQIETAQDDELAMLHEQIAELEHKTGVRESLQGEIATLKEEAAECRATNNSLKLTMNELKERIDTLKQVAGAACPLCGQPLTDEHRAELLESLQEEGTEQGDTFRANVARIDEIAEQQADLTDQIEWLSGEIAVLPRLQKRAGELAAQSEAAAEARTALVGAEERLAEVEVLLAEETYAQDVRAELDALHTEKAELGYSESEHEEQREALESFREYEKLHTRLSIAEESLPPLLKAQQGLQERAARLERALAESDEKLMALETEIAHQEERVDVYRQRNEETMLRRTEEKAASNRVEVAKQALSAVDDARKRVETYEARRATAAEQYGVFDELRTAFGKRGVPAMIIETAIPELEAIANDLLTRMTDGRMALTFSTQREKVSGGSMETLDISIADELGTRSYDLYSGGEAFRINFAIRVALSKLLARRAGAHLETLFIDEGFGTQDAEGRDKLVEAINVVKDDFDLILVITHIDDLKDAFPVHISIEKTPNGSMVEVR